MDCQRQFVNGSVSICLHINELALPFLLIFFFISPSEELVGRRTRKPYLLKHHYNHSKKRRLHQAVRRVTILHGIVYSLFFFWSTSLYIRIALDTHLFRQKEWKKNMPAVASALNRHAKLKLVWVSEDAPH